MRYFSHTLAVGFFGLSLAFHSWPLGACAVAIVAFITAKDIYEALFTARKQSDLERLLKSALEENLKVREEVAKLSSTVGAMNYKVSQMQSYVGAPDA